MHACISSKKCILNREKLFKRNIKAKKGILLKPEKRKRQNVVEYPLLTDQVLFRRSSDAANNSLTWLTDTLEVVDLVDASASILARRRGTFIHIDQARGTGVPCRHQTAGRTQIIRYDRSTKHGRALDCQALEYGTYMLQSNAKHFVKQQSTCPDANHTLCFTQKSQTRRRLNFECSHAPFGESRLY